MAQETDPTTSTMSDADSASLGAKPLALDMPQPTEDLASSPGILNEDPEALRNKEAETQDDEPNHAPYTVFSPRMKLFIVIMAAWAAFFSPLSGNIYYPALNSLANEFDVSSSKINLTLTVYMIMQGLAPAFVGDFADMYGRRPAYVLGFVVYIAANVGIALVDSFAGLMVLRCLQSAGSSGMIALASGVAADVSTSDERGKYMGSVLSGTMLGPAVGPVIGGLLAEFLGWRSIFWFLTILSGCFLVPFAIAFPETGRNVVASGSVPPQWWNKTFFDLFAKRRALEALGPAERTQFCQAGRHAHEVLASKREMGIPNPLNALRIIGRPEAAILLAFNSINFAAFYDISASLPYLLREIYGLNELQIGLCFLPFGLGCFMAPLFNGPLLDWRFHKVARKSGIAIDKSRGNKLDGFPIERARLPVAWPMSTVAALTVICYGWVMEREAHLGVPLVLLYIMGACFVASANVCSTMIVDYNPSSPSTATAANNLCRCLFSAGATAIIIDMIQGMGRGWCFTFIGLVVVAAGPLLLVISKYGPGWRNERRDRLAQHSGANAREGYRKRSPAAEVIPVSVC